MKILVLGAEGMLGHVVKIYFEEKGCQVNGTSRTGNNNLYVFDAVKKINDLDQIIDDFQPKVVINCIGILNEKAEKNHAMAVQVNALLPNYLNELTIKKQIKFIHVSTDCVFAGDKGEYEEQSFRNAVSFYGRSKALGEIDNKHNLTLRTSIVGPDINEKGIGLFQWFMKQQGEIMGYDQVIWTGVTTIELAKAMEKAIKNNLTGIRHVVNNQKISKYDLLNLFKKHWQKKITIKKKSDYISDKSLIRKTDFDFEIPSYEKMVAEMKEWMDNHNHLYHIKMEK